MGSPTDDDLTRIECKLAELIGCLQEPFGCKRDRAEQKVRGCGAPSLMKVASELQWRA
jgi:uncharacterized protein YjbJ (UPF0337 family)